ncbi:carbon-nitrogen hydrolase family protein [Isoptericola sp. NEAU-Y5]|uniref:Carbon-nitrogen hydrolase family protein n=1 Tax=Isoptericola luteus TaxID=2879484 RepID=A0ABS7ZCN6_9MICO|nr:carbon-nitrogen hydrolase family protein [Isoptericola sp. NEAU-Y5]MCA5892814.1 carbon-nitrogen hydrolase family protein [Isoptericola sp. NEAU-Y5]
MTTPVRLTVAQLAASGDHAANREAVADAFVSAARVGADLLALPEYASGYDARGVGTEHAEPLDGPFVSALRENAARYRIAVIAGTTIPATGEAPPVPGQAALTGQIPAITGSLRALTGSTRAVPRGTSGAGAGEGRVSNAVVAVDDTGALVGVYRKVHLYDAFGTRESDRLEAGPADTPPLVVRVGDLRFGVVTCYDLRFPESARRVVDAGADVIVVPAAWVAGPLKDDHWRTLLRARAIENTAVVVGVGMAGEGLVGRSLLAGPDGVVGLELDDAPQVATVDLDPEPLAQVRAHNPSLANRRYVVVPRP